MCENRINYNNYFKINLDGVFYGTEHYYEQPFTNIKLTDGIKYISGNGLGWLVDEIIYNKDIIKNVFVSIELKAENNKGIISWVSDDEKKHYEKISCAFAKRSAGHPPHDCICLSRTT